MKGLAPPKDIFDNIFKGNNHERDAGIHIQLCTKWTRL